MATSQWQEFNYVEAMNEKIVQSLKTAAEQVQGDKVGQRTDGWIEKLLSALMPNADAAVVIPCIAAVKASLGTGIIACLPGVEAIKKDWDEFKKKWDENKKTWARIFAVLAFVAKAG